MSWEKVHNGDIWYIAHPSSGNEEQNFKDCIEFTNRIKDMGYNVFSPVVMNHPLHTAKNRDWQHWMDCDYPFMEICKGIILPPHWEKSKGCRVEKEWFEAHNKPVIIIKEFI